MEDTFRHARPVDNDTTGTYAHSPLEIPVAGWKEILFRVKDNLAEDHVTVVSAGVAFFGLLAIFPAIAALISIAGVFLDPVVVATELDRMVAVLPENAAEIIQGQVTAVTKGDEAATGLAAILGIVLALYGAMKGVKTLMEGTNIAYDETESRGFIRLSVTAFLLTLALVVGLLLALTVIIFLPVMLDFVGWSAATEHAVTILKWPVLAGLTLLGLSVLYRFAPDRADAKWRWITPGALLATMLWMIGTAGFSIYAENFGSYNETYGTIGGVIALLAWLWLSSYIVLIGAELNAEIECQMARDTTTGPPESMGERDATVADKHPDGLGFKASNEVGLRDDVSDRQPDRSPMKPLPAALLMLGVTLFVALQNDKGRER